MIRIELKFFVTLSSYLPENSDHYKIDKNKSVADLIADLKIPSELVKLIFINGRRQESSYKFQPGDRVGLFPPIGGG